MCERLGVYLDRISALGIGARIFDQLAERRWWRIVFHHEAGHAVAWAALFGQYKNMTAQDQMNDDQFPARKRKASYGGLPSQPEFDDEPLNTTIVLAAGAQAERCLFGINSDGFIGDREKLRALYFGPLNVDRNHLQAALDSVSQEVDADYPKTRALVRRYVSALRAIGRAALERFDAARLLGKPFNPRVILTAADVQTLFQSHPPTD